MASGNEWAFVHEDDELDAALGLGCCTKGADKYGLPREALLLGDA